MNWQKLISGFNLDEHLIVDEQVDAKSGFKPDFAILNGQHHLSRYGQISGLELICQALFVNRLEKSRSERDVHGVSRIDDLTRSLINERSRFFHFLGALASWRFDSILIEFRCQGKLA